MDISIKFDTVKSVWTIVYIYQIDKLYFPKNNVFLSLKTDFVLAKSADPD